jgi:hypothetical protein
MYNLKLSKFNFIPSDVSRVILVPNAVKRDVTAMQTLGLVHCTSVSLRAGHTLLIIAYTLRRLMC